MPYSVKESALKSNTAVQPYILCTKGQNGCNTYFVQGGGFFLKPSNNEPVNTFDLLFKAYLALNLCYPIGLQIFFNFMDSYVYVVNNQPRGIVTSFHVNLTNLTLDETTEGMNLSDN